VNVIIIEGTLIFHDKSLRDKLDLKVFLSGDRDVRLSRKSVKFINF
jgi:uridine kinase